MSPGEDVPHHLLRAGDHVILRWVESYQHCACLRVTKVNRGSLTAVETRGSYVEGQVWRVLRTARLRLDIRANRRRRLLDFGIRK